MKPRTAMYAGTFDPITLGHYDLIERSSDLFDHVILAVARVSVKDDSLFTSEERVALAERVVAKLGNVKVVCFDGMLVEFARKMGVRILIRGLRAYSDFEYEFQMALTNRTLAPDIETLFMMPKEIHSYVSSSTVREVARYGGDTRRFVPQVVEKAILRKMAK